VELYTPVLALGIIAAGFAIFSVVVSSLTGPKRYNRAKLDSYE
jgi:NADH-quinone oxidoreductase subunit A